MRRIAARENNAARRIHTVGVVPEAGVFRIGDMATARHRCINAVALLRKFHKDEFMVVAGLERKRGVEFLDGLRRIGRIADGIGHAVAVRRDSQALPNAISVHYAVKLRLLKLRKRHAGENKYAARCRDVSILVVPVRRLCAIDGKIRRLEAVHAVSVDCGLGQGSIHYRHAGNHVSIIVDELVTQDRARLVKAVRDARPDAALAVRQFHDSAFEIYISRGFGFLVLRLESKHGRNPAFGLRDGRIRDSIACSGVVADLRTADAGGKFMLCVLREHGDCRAGEDELRRRRERLRNAEREYAVSFRRNARCDFAHQLGTRPRQRARRLVDRIIYVVKVRAVYIFEIPALHRFRPNAARAVVELEMDGLHNRTILAREIEIDTLNILAGSAGGIDLRLVGKSAVRINKPASHAPPEPIPFKICEREIGENEPTAGRDEAVCKLDICKRRAVCRNRLSGNSRAYCGRDKRNLPDCKRNQ